MKHIKVAHPSGVGDWPYGTVVALPDRHADKLIWCGYAIEVPRDDVGLTGAKRVRKAERTH